MRHKYMRRAISALYVEKQIAACFPQKNN